MFVFNLLSTANLPKGPNPDLSPSWRCYRLAASWPSLTTTEAFEPTKAPVPDDGKTWLIDVPNCSIELRMGRVSGRLHCFGLVLPFQAVENVQADPIAAALLSLSPLDEIADHSAQHQ